MFSLLGPHISPFQQITLKLLRYGLKKLLHFCLHQHKGGVFYMHLSVTQLLKISPHNDMEVLCLNMSFLIFILFLFIKYLFYLCVPYYFFLLPQAPDSSDFHTFSCFILLTISRPQSMLMNALLSLYIYFAKQAF